MMNNQSNAIQTRRLSKTFGGCRVLREIDLQITSGECVALTGSNGAGKTTLLRCLAAITRPTTGEVDWFGQGAAANPDHRRLVGFVAHESHLYAHLTLLENLMFAARMCGVTEPAQRADKLLEQIGLRSWANQQVRKISEGMRKRLALARALIHDPRILLLDEPFSGLDAASRDWLGGLLDQYRADGCAVCFATHSEEHSRRLADRTLILQRGSLAAHHEAATTAANENILRYAV